MKHLKKIALLSLALALGTAHAADFQSEFIKRYPTASNAKFSPAFPGFWSVVKNGEVLFVAEDMSILINGEVVDLKTNTSLTNQLREANRPAIDVSKLDLKDAIRIGNGSRRLFVFSDPDCPFCRRVEPELAKLKDVSIYVFPFPLVQLHPNAAAVSTAIWCSKDRAAAWRAYMLAGQVPQTKQCDTPIARNITLGSQLGINGTPSLIFEDGVIIPGAVDANRIEGQLKIAAAKKQAAQ